LALTWAIVGNGGVGLRRVVDLELHQQAAQVALVAGQRAVQQESPLGLVELQQSGQGVDVFLDQSGLLLERHGSASRRSRLKTGPAGPWAASLAYSSKIEKQRGFFVGAAPGAMARQELAFRPGQFVATPEVVV
jgi:hypothetical protein